MSGGGDPPKLRKLFYHIIPSHLLDSKTMHFWHATFMAVLAAAAPGGWAWRQTPTPHFLILHETTWLSPGLTIGVERIHSRLRMDMGSFSPWMAKERISLYVYRDLDSYGASDFHPPAWSNGVAVYEKKAVAIPAMRDAPRMLRIIAHETAHLLFVTYFRERRRDPPSWLNEGLAMVEEAEFRDRPETSAWYQNMVEMKPEAWLPMARFLEINPTKDLLDDKTRVSEWYVQAYSITHFLLRRHSNLQFKSFCARLREGAAPMEALRLVYRYRTLQDFEKTWRAWLLDPDHRRRVNALAASQRDTDDGALEGDSNRSTRWGSFKTGR